MNRIIKPDVMKIKQIIKELENFAPLALQESYDNAGLAVGDAEMEVNAALLCLDVTPGVLEEAKNKGAGLVISHHPVIFGKLGKLTGSTYTEKIVIQAIKNEIALYSAHTNFDRVTGGVNSRIADKIGIRDCEIISPADGVLKKLVVFVPRDHAQQVRQAIFDAGAGHIGEYDQCSFNLEGEGSFRGSEKSDPFTGKPGILHFEKEIRVETIFPGFLESGIIDKMIGAHPYEEVAYDIYPLDNKYDRAGMGIIGELNEPVEEQEFLKMLKEIFQARCIRHTRLSGKKISRVAVCGGSCGFLVGMARKQGADIFVSGEIKYHDFFQPDQNMMLAEVGHFESEQFTLEIFHELLTKKFPNFAVHFSDQTTNPIQYF
jgi:dinuclear metal center YbgI/SA1388 family protein